MRWLNILSAWIKVQIAQQDVESAQAQIKDCEAALIREQINLDGWICIEEPRRQCDLLLARKHYEELTK